MTEVIVSFEVEAGYAPGKIVGHVVHDGEPQRFDLSWGEMEAWWRGKLCNNPEDHWFGEVAASIHDAIEAALAQSGRNPEDVGVRADVRVNDEEITVLKLAVFEDGLPD